MYNSSSFKNHGALLLSNCSNCLSNNSGTFENKIDGTAIIDSANFNGLLNYDHFINEGYINIKNTTNTGVRNSNNSDSLINKGTILITGAKTGLIHDPSSFILINEGNITIDSILNNCIFLTNKTINDGTLTLNNGSIGLNFNSSPDTLWNSGKINITNNSNGINIFDAPLVNTDCGSIINHNNFFASNTSTIENQGYFEQIEGLLAPSSVDFKNSGILYDSIGIIRGLPNFSNMGLISQPLLPDLSIGIKELPMFLKAANPIHSISTNWWADAGQTIVAGNYLDTDYSFTPNLAAVATETIWFEAAAPGCNLTIPIRKASAGCGGGSFTTTLTFTAAVSDDWHVPANWDTNQVPEPCSRVIIPSAKSCKIYGGRKARAFDIISDTGSVLNVEDDVVMAVVPF